MSSSSKAITPSILDLINQTCELPTLPDVLVKLNEVMADPEASAEDAAAVISLDPPIATNILRIVNSAYYGLQVRVSSVNLAISIMGFNMTKKVALKAAVFSAFAKKDTASQQFDPTSFWRHSIYTGVLARVLGQASPGFGGIHPEDIYICGLLHDIGKIILLESAPQQFERVLAMGTKENRPLQEVESEVFGYSHADVGSVLAIKWFLPEELTIAIRYHETPEADPFHTTLSSLVCLADRIANRSGRLTVRGVPIADVTPQLLETVGIAEDELDGLIEKANEDFAASGMPW